MKISILLPCSARRPSGGFRIIYEHANRLVAKGHEIRLAHISSSELNLPLKRLPRAFAKFSRDRLLGSYLPDGWFKFDQSIRTSLMFRPTTDNFPKGDVVIATAWETASLVRDLPNQCGKKFYFIQSYENWSGPDELVRETWKMPLRKIVIAKWLANIAADLGERYDYVPNGIDLEFFKVVTPIENRSSNLILFQSMPRALKGSAETVTALNMIRKTNTDIEISCFGMIDPSEFGLEKPYKFYHNPSQRLLVELYNNAAIYVTASHVEGWSLTLAEAAACGATLVASNIGGHTDLANDGVNALLFESRDIGGLVSRIETLVRSRSLRIALAKQALSDVNQFDWNTSSLRLENVLAG